MSRAAVLARAGSEAHGLAKRLLPWQPEGMESANNNLNPIAPVAGELTGSGHRLVARVYFADTDFTGVVYHARYLEFFERGRSDFLRLAGVHHNELAEGKHGEVLAWVVKRMEIDFRQPARIDDILTVETVTEDVSGARIFMAQKIMRGDAVLVTARVEAAIIGGNGRPRRFPKEWVPAFMPQSRSG